MALEEEYSIVQVVYQLNWDGKFEDPHMIEVQYPPGQDGVRLRDVKKRLTLLRGQGINHSFSWSYKRNYKSTFIWKDLSDDDVIHPLHGSGDFVLKASQLIDIFASKPAENLAKCQNKEKQGSFKTQVSRGCGLDLSNQSDHRSYRIMWNGNVACANRGNSLNAAKQSRSARRSDDSKQEVIDVERSDFCLSSSDNEISPRLLKMVNCKPVKDTLAKIRQSSTLQGVQTLPYDSLPSSIEPPSTPGSAKRLWKREIRKSLFGMRNTNLSPPSERSGEYALLSPEASHVECMHDDISFWSGCRSKSLSTLHLSEIKEEHEENDKQEIDQSTSNIIRSLWSRWTRGSSKGRRSLGRTCEVSLIHPSDAAKTLKTKTHPQANVLRTCSNSPIKEKISTHVSRSCQETRHLPVLHRKSSRTPEENQIPRKKELAHCQISKAKILTKITLSRTEVNFTIADEEAPSNVNPHNNPRELNTKEAVLSVPSLQSEPDSSEIDIDKGSSEKDAETPTSAVTRVLVKSAINSNGPPSVKKTTSPMPLPPGFHKGTNDTKPVQTPRKAIGKKCINFPENHEKSFIHGLTTSDWEKALQDPETDCLPPPNFGQFLQECPHCGRTFKPDSLLVHMRGCHPPEYARAFSARASPHQTRSQGY